MKEEPAGWCPGVNGIGEALELDALLVQFADQIDQVLDAAAKAKRIFEDKIGGSLAERPGLAK